MFLQLGSFLAQLQSSMAGANRIFEILDQPREPLNYPIIVEQQAQGEAVIRMNNVEFGYTQNNKILKGININLNRGHTAALVGYSGCGKSTILKLLLGFYPTDRGGIYICGKPIGQYKLSELRAIIAYVPQDPYFFEGTIEENIWYGCLEATMVQVIAAARDANAHDFIIEQPHGYETFVGEGGLRLSGGQKQRIAIARAILKNAPILLLDEATSSLDTESEKLVQDALNILKKDRTTIVVAHRLSTIQNADVIYVIQDGNITNKGKHGELLNISETYNKLWSLYNEQYA